VIKVHRASWKAVVTICTRAIFVIINEKAIATIKVVLFLCFRPSHDWVGSSTITIILVMARFAIAVVTWFTFVGGGAELDQRLFVFALSAYFGNWHAIHT